MYTAENYYWGLVGYYLGCAMLMLFVCRFRKIVPGRHFRNILVLFVAAVILVPIYAYQDNSFLAPAWFVGIFEGITAEVEQAYMRGIKPILICYVVAVCFYLIWAIYDSRRNHTRVAKRPVKVDPE
jgi:hypothetical protein